MAKQTFTTGQVLTAAQMTSLQQTAMGGGLATAKTASYVLTAADAGTTIIMNSGSATIITVNTGLFTAGDTVFIVNQGAGICTITAGTATVSTAASLVMSTNETGQLYFLSASAAIFTEYMQSAGSGGLPTNWTLLNAGGTALTGAASITVSFTAPKRLMVLMIAASGGARSFMTLRPNNISTADYSAAGMNAQFSNTPGSYALTYGYGGYSTFTSIPMGTMSNNAASTVDAACVINLTDQTGWKDFTVGAAGTNTVGEGNQLYSIAGILEAAATITSITLLSDVGNFDAGTVYVLGAN